MAKAKKTLVDKAQSKMEQLRLKTESQEAPVGSVEALRNLGKALASHLDAATHLEGVKKEYQIAKGHFAVATDELRRAHKAVKRFLKQQAEETRKKAKKDKKRSSSF